jgi:hypothetical protein
MTMTLIETKTLGTSQTSIEFTLIPQDGTDLLLLVSGRGTRSDNRDQFQIRFNSITSGYSARLLQGNGATAASAGDTSQALITRMDMPAATTTANTFGNASVYIPNYTAAVNKSVSIDSVTENNGTTAYQQIISALMANTAPISSIYIEPEVADIAAGSVFSLYKITKGTDGIVVVS